MGVMGEIIVMGVLDPLSGEWISGDETTKGVKRFTLIEHCIPNGLNKLEECQSWNHFFPIGESR